jgi:hypothetical protein
MFASSIFTDIPNHNGHPIKIRCVCSPKTLYKGGGDIELDY